MKIAISIAASLRSLTRNQFPGYDLVDLFHEVCLDIRIGIFVYRYSGSSMRDENDTDPIHYFAFRYHLLYLPGKFITG